MTRKITKSNQSEQRSDRGAKRSDRGGADGGGAGLLPYGVVRVRKLQIQVSRGEAHFINFRPPFSSAKYLHVYFSIDKQLKHGRRRTVTTIYFNFGY